MDTETKEKLTEALMLLEDNERVAASDVGLRHRANNRRMAIGILADVLGIDHDAVADLYWEWFEAKEAAVKE